MTDFPHIAPPRDGLVQAMATARSRRLRKASASSGASALALTLVAVLVGSSGRSTLTQQPTPEQPAVNLHVVPDGGQDKTRTTDRPNVLTPLTGSGAGTTTSAARPSTASAVVANQPSTALDLSRDQRGVAGSRTSPHVTGPMKSEQQTTSPSDVACPVNKSASGQDVVCPEAFASAQYDSNSKVTGYQLETYVCNYTTRSYQLSYASARELDVVIRDSKNQVVWRWSLEHPDRDQPHTVTIPTGGCWYWETYWALVDQQGRPLPKGSYSMVSLQQATELSGQDDATYSFNLT